MNTLKAGKWFPYAYVVNRSKHGSLDELVFNTETGSFAPRAFNKSDDRTLSHSEWVSASLAVAAVTRQLHTPGRADALEQHHRNVGTLYLDTQNWPACREYDIMQREFWAEDVQYDITVLNWELYSRARARAESVPAAVTVTTLANSSRPKRPFSSTVSAATPSGVQKRPRFAGASASTVVTHCFRCGHGGHLPSSCTATTTSAGKPVAPLNPSARTANGLLAPDGRPYCFNFSQQGSCFYGSACSRSHGCSICAAAFGHGAGSCPQAA